MSKVVWDQMNAELAETPWHTIQVLTTAVCLPNGAIEVATNTTHLEDKIKYIITAYNGYGQLKSNNLVELVGYMIV